MIEWYWVLFACFSFFMMGWLIKRDKEYARGFEDGIIAGEKERSDH
jgi:hypothetical protein